MYNHELTEEYKALINGVVDGIVIPTQREDEPDGYLIAENGKLSFYVYPWTNAADEAKAQLENPISIALSIEETNFVWRRIKSSTGYTIQSDLSYRGGAYSPSYYKPRARVALEALRNRLDKGVL
jgi:hypothetical protein